MASPQDQQFMEDTRQLCARVVEVAVVDGRARTCRLVKVPTLLQKFNNLMTYLLDKKKQAHVIGSCGEHALVAYWSEGKDKMVFVRSLHGIPCNIDMNEQAINWAHVRRLHNWLQRMNSVHRMVQHVGQCHLNNFPVVY